jgi:hypothetical protein
VSDIFHTQVALHNFDFPEFQLTFKLATAVVAADTGKAVSLDATAPNTVKLVADNEPIFGRLYTYEDRTIEGQKVGTVELKFARKLAILSGQTVVVGDRLIGAGNGLVKAHPAPSTAALAASHARAPIVVAVAGGFATALFI